jgi:diguanylate cyclase (GGDEF)-like protein
MAKDSVPRERRRPHSVTRTFSVVSLVAMTALGVLLVGRIQMYAESQALASGDATAELLREVFVEEAFGGNYEVFNRALTPAYTEEIDQLVNVRMDSAVNSLRIWSPEGALFYNSEGGLDTALPDRALLNSAVRAETAHGLRETPGSEPAVVSWVPIVDPNGVVRGAMELELPYAAAAQRAWAETRQTALLVVGGLGVLWLLLFRTVFNASRQLRRSAQENAELALLDALTGLPNRRLLSDRLERAAAASARTGVSVGLLLLDVDRFKEVNDTLGHPRGDKLLKQIAERLSGAVRDADTVARLGGDEFAILMPTVASLADAEAFGRRIGATFDEPFDLDGLVLHVDSSIGLALLPDHADDVTTLLQRADVAMYTAKAAHLGVATYSAAGDEHSPARLILLGDLRQAMDTDQLAMHYQPKVDLKTGEVVGLEALIRWFHPTRGLVPPNDFIPLAERTGLIQALTHRVLGMVVAQLAVWQRAGIELPVAVNLSARNLMEPDLDTTIEALLQACAVPARLLEIEITESAMIEDPARAELMMRKLTAVGLTVAVDDFGTGYTSMAQLETMPVRTLKIDRSFVQSIGEDPGNSVIAKAIIDLAHEFGLQAVAEGVEDRNVTRKLQELDCDVAQGFLWSRPIPAEDLPATLRRIADEFGGDPGAPERVPATTTRTV